MPEEYAICILGHLDDAWLVTFPGLEMERLENGQTLLSGAFPDQSALHGVLERIRDLNLTLVSVTRSSVPDTDQNLDLEK